MTITARPDHARDDPAASEPARRSFTEKLREKISTLPRQQLRDAARLSLQSAVAVSAVYTIMATLGLPEIYIALISSVLVVTPSSAGTLASAKNRLLATVFGSVVGVLCLYVLPYGAGTAVALAISMLVVNGVTAFRPEWSYGAVAAIALALHSEQDAFQTALDRGVAIALGAVGGTLVALVVWRDKADERAARHLADALRNGCEHFETAVGRTIAEHEGEPKKAQGSFFQSLSNAREAIDAMRSKEAKSYREQFELVERFYNSTLIINRVGRRGSSLRDEERELHQSIDCVRQVTGQIANGLADGDLKSDIQLDQMDEQLRHTRHQIATRKANQDPPVERAALAFGLEEIGRSLRALAGTLRPTEPDGGLRA